MQGFFCFSDKFCLFYANPRSKNAIRRTKLSSTSTLGRLNSSAGGSATRRTVCLFLSTISTRSAFLKKSSERAISAFFRLKVTLVAEKPETSAFSYATFIRFTSGFGGSPYVARMPASSLSLSSLFLISAIFL